MKGLFDTHSFLWWNSDPQNLSQNARDFCNASENELLLSVVSLWELQIKIQLGKLTLIRPLREIVEDQVRANRVTLLPVTPEHIYTLENLPPIHRDPFDRLLIAQSNIEAAPIISADHLVQQYPVSVIW